MYFSTPGLPVYLTQAVSDTVPPGSSAQLPLPDVPGTVIGSAASGPLKAEAKRPGASVGVLAK